MVDKIVMLLEAKGWDQDELESMAGLAHGRISKWKADKGEPTARQALRIARLLEVSMEFLADDELAEPVPAPSLTLEDDERVIIDLYHDLELSRQEAVKRLATPLATGAAWLPGPVRNLDAPSPPRNRPTHRDPAIDPRPNDAVTGRVHRQDDDVEERKPKRKGG